MTSMALRLILCTFSFTSSSLILSYQFSQNFGQIFYDYSGTGNHGQNGASLSFTSTSTVPTDRGAYFSSYINKYIMLPPNSIISTSLSLGSTFSISMWCLVFNNQNSFLTARVANGGSYLYIEKLPFYSVYFISLKRPGFNSGSTYGSIQINQSKKHSDVWSFLSFINVGSVFSFYVNGAVSVQLTQSSNYTESGSYQHYIGYTSNSFTGFVWSYQINTDEINNNNYFLSTYSGSNCLVNTCPATCSPGILSAGSGYCISVNLDNTKDGQGDTCPALCLNLYGCNSGTCLDCSQCASKSCEFNSTVICLCSGGSLTATGCACPSNAYYNSSSSSCVSCYGECVNCSSYYACLVCSDANALPFGDYGCECDVGFYNDTALIMGGKCKACNVDCKSCTTATQCVECLDANAVPGVIGCKCTHYYYKGVLGCTKCNSDCLTCSQSLLCDSCIAQYSVPDSNVGCVCESNYYNLSALVNTNACIQCYDHCLTCQTALLCLTCIAENASANNQIGCTCDDGYFNTTDLTNNAACIPCYTDCSKCEESNICTECKDPTASIASIGCTCPPGTFKLPTGLCSDCLADCSACSSFITCTQCKDPFSSPSSSGCECLSSYFNNSTSALLSCTSCPENCSDCTSLTNCITCKYKNMNLVNGICECPGNSTLIDKTCECFSGFYIEISDQSSFSCKICYNSCLSCNGPSSNNCLKCAEGKYFGNGSCFVCPSDCLACTDADFCIKCQDSTKIIANGKCVLNCTEGFFLNATQCDPCPNLCAWCNGDCTQCKTNAEFLDQTCNCSKGFKESNNTCIDAYFSASLRISDANLVLITFSQPTEQSLTVSNFIFWININSSNNSSDITTTLLKNNKNSEYLFSVASNTVSLDNKPLTIQINQPVLYSEYGSKLEAYTLEGIFVNTSFSSLSQAISQLINSTGSASAIFVSSSLGTSIVSSPGPAWSLLNTITIITYLPLNSNPLTPNLINFFTSFSSYNLIPNYFVYVFSADASSDPYYESQRYGVNTSVFLLNIGQNSMVFLFFVGIWPLLTIVARYLKGPIGKKCAGLVKNYKYNFFIRFWIQMYLQIGVYCLIQLRAVKNM